MTDIRWSYDPRTNELDVWDSNDGRVSHYDRCGNDGYQFCAQGRLAEIHLLKGKNKVLHSVSASIYGDRPFAVDNNQEAKANEVREKGKKAIEEHFDPYPVHWQLTF